MSAAAISAQDVINRAQKENKKTFPYIQRGKLNMVCLRDNRESVLADNATSEEFLQNPKVVRSAGLDRIDFHPNVSFKVTLDFKTAKDTLNAVECAERNLPYTVREVTDWMLLTCLGHNAFYDRNLKKLVLMHCVANVSVTHDMLHPITIILGFDEDEWIAERVFGQ